MGNYLNPDNRKFEEAVNSAVYIDKTGLIEYTNSVLHAGQCLREPSAPFWEVDGGKYADGVL